MLGRRSGGSWQTRLLRTGATSGVALLIAVQGCSTTVIKAEVTDRVCQELEKAPVGVIQTAIERAITQLEAQGVIVVKAEVWSDPETFTSSVNALRRAVGCQDVPIESDLGERGISRQALAQVNYCGPGRDNGRKTTTVSSCLNEICLRHDSCYTRCSASTEKCPWAEATGPCDDAFFADADDCDHSGQGLNSLIVIGLARAIRGIQKTSPIAASSCPPTTMRCPQSEGPFGWGPCSVDRDGAACSACLKKVDQKACFDHYCAEATDADRDVCLTASCEPVAECFGWPTSDPPPTKPPPTKPPPVTPCTPGCAAGFVCSATLNACVLDPNKSWTVTIVSGATTATDIDGPPDPRVCINLQGELCTDPVESATPTWNKKFPAQPVATWLAGVPFRYFDVDVAIDDPICSGTLTFTEPILRSGQFTLTCAGSISNSFTGTVVPN